MNANPHFPSVVAPVIGAVLLFFFTISLSPAAEKKSPVSDTSVVSDMVLIPAGIYNRGCTRFGPQHGNQDHLAYLDTFMIDKYEVSNKAYEEIIPQHELRRSPFSHCDNCPVSKVSWYEAADYCHLIGKGLPSEAQWEKAAGNDKGCEFPWGPGFDLNNPQARGGLKLRDNSAPVGSFPPNKYGVYDMGGNVWEWVSDWYSVRPHFREDILYNPRGPSRGIMKVRRGGSWSDSIKAMSVGYRDRSYPFSRGFNDIGIRCAINVKIK